MFIKEIAGTNKKYLYLSRSVRDGKKVKQENILSFGAIDELNEKELKNIAFKLLSYCSNPEMIPLNDLKEDNRQNWGAIAITQKLLDLFSTNTILDKLIEKRKIKRDIFTILKFLIAERLSSPRSKYASFQHKEWYIQNIDINLQDIYRTLDFFAENKTEIQQHFFEKQKMLFKLDISIVFYDVTTLYFESKTEDDLKKFGYGKDGKFNEVQVVVGVLMDRSGRPLDYEVFSGNTYEGNTLEKFIDRVKEKFNISKVIIVSDRGLNSGENLLKIKNANCDFIVGFRIKNTSKEIKDEILDNKNYIDISRNKDEILKYKIIEFERKIKDEKGEKQIIKDKIVVTYSSRRAKKDKRDRERLIEKARNIINKPSVINSKRGAKKYIDMKLEKAKLNESKIVEDSKWDGYYGIEFSEENLTAEAVLAAYHSLWRIENLFRILKTHLEARPIFHWTPKRIQGHFCLCFIALVLERTIEIECYEKHGVTSQNSIRDAINSLQVSKIIANKNEYYIFSKISNYAQSILDIVKITPPSPVMTHDAFAKMYL